MFRIKYIGLREDHNSETLRKIIMLNLFLFIGFVLLVTMGTIALFQGATQLFISDYTLAGIFFILLLYLLRTGNETVTSLLLLCVVLLFYLYLFILGGINNTAYMWLYVFPLLALYLLGLRKGVWVVSILYFCCVGFLVIDLAAADTTIYTKNFAIRFLPSFLVVCILSTLVERSRYSTRRHLEEARRLLEERVLSRTMELERANQRLMIEIEERELAEEESTRLEAALSRSEKMESLGRLAGGVAHDLNNVLSGIVSYPDLLLLQLPADSPMREPLLNIRHAGKRAAAIVDDLLSLARRGITTREAVQLNDIISSHLHSLEVLSLTGNNPGIRIDTDLSPDLFLMSGSPVHLEKMLMNLLINSFEAIEDEGHILITTENQFIDFPAQRPNVPSYGEYLVLKISDSGIGIPSENIDKIFEPFYSSKVMGKSGTGLGMTVIWGTITDHEGYLDILSSPGDGTIITIYFPILQDDPEISNHSAPAMVTIPGIERGNQEKILVVDDAPEQRSLCKNILTSIGYRVFTVSSGEDAVAFFQEGMRVDLVLLDMIMDPGIDGLDTYQQILQIRPNQQVIIVSGYCESERIQQAFDMGVRNVVKKPYTLTELAAAVSSTLTV